MELLKHWLDSSKLFNRPDSAAGLSQIQTVYAAFAICWVIFLIFDWTGIDLPRKKLSRKDTVDWHSRVISSVHAIILCVGALGSYMELQGVTREALVKGYAVWPDVFARIFLGYLLYDTSNMLVYFKYLGDPSAIVHHALFMMAAAYVLDQSVMAFPFIWLALGEISTPSVNLRWHLAVLGEKESNLYLINGLLLTFLFFSARVICYGAGLWHLWGLRDVWAGPKEPVTNYILVALFCLGYALNLYWMQAILKGAIKAVRRPTTKKQA
ncbi:g193 [Coccomyxa viridis]|uniref:G193 protein n=1 Tax=Coccomyxa viridis TaxID=1274662 RepID=A0ABP1FFC0_9CHLO